MQGGGKSQETDQIKNNHAMTRHLGLSYRSAGPIRSNEEQLRQETDFAERAEGVRLFELSISTCHVEFVLADRACPKDDPSVPSS